MKNQITFQVDEKAAEEIRKLAQKLDISLSEICRAGVNLILKMKVADQKALLKKK